MEARPNEFTPSPEELSEEEANELQARLDYYSEEFKIEVDQAAERIGYGDWPVSFDEMYQQLAEMSVQCMSMFLRIRYMQDYLLEQQGKDEE